MYMFMSSKKWFTGRMHKIANNIATETLDRSFARSVRLIALQKKQFWQSTCVKVPSLCLTCRSPVFSRSSWLVRRSEIVPALATSLNLSLFASLSLPRPTVGTLRPAACLEPQRPPPQVEPSLVWDCSPSPCSFSTVPSLGLEGHVLALWACSSSPRGGEQDLLGRVWRVSGLGLCFLLNGASPWLTLL